MSGSINPFDAPDEEYANPYEPPGGSHKLNSKSTYGRVPSDVVPLVPLTNISLSSSSSSPYANVPSGRIDGGGGGGGLDDREATLRAREEAVAEKERQLRIREDNLGVAPRAPNWPFACYPITYHDIAAEIPLHHQPLVKKFYYAMLTTWACLTWNWITMLTIWGQTDEGSSDVVYSTIYIVLGIPGSWVFWYKQIYLGCRDSGSIKFAAFFCNFSIHIAFCLIMGLGIPLVAGGGLLVVIKMLAKGKTLSCVFAFFDMIAYLLLTFFCVYLIKKAHAVWKAGGGEQALQRDTATFAINNAHHVQRATATTSV